MSPRRKQRGSSQRRHGRKSRTEHAQQNAPSIKESSVQRGVVKWFNRSKGYGFIQCDTGEEVFIHQSAIVLGSNDSALAKGRHVEFEIRDTPKGKQAFSAVIIEGEANESERAKHTSDHGESDSPITLEKTLDLSRRFPSSWYSRSKAFVYTYAVSGKRNNV